MTDRRIAAPGLLVVLVGAGLLGACSGPSAPTAASGEPVGPGASAQAPVMLDAVRKGDSVLVTGRAAPEAIVRISSPEGQSWGVTASPEGVWSFTLPVGAAPRMFALSEETQGREMRADGAIMLLPQPSLTALVARAGFGAQSVARPGAGPVITSVDYDQGGGAMVSGLVAPGMGVRLVVDETPAGETRSDPAGRFVAVSTGRPLNAGQHRLRVETVAGEAVVDLVVSPPSLGGKAVYGARREDGAWRLDWRTAGGGVQSTVVPDTAASALAGGGR